MNKRKLAITVETQNGPLNIIANDYVLEPDKWYDIVIIMKSKISTKSGWEYISYESYYYCIIKLAM